MSNQDIPPQARRIYYTGALAAMDRQIEHLQAERERIAWELDRAKEEMVQGTENRAQS